MSNGKIHSIQSLGTLDGPGVRFVVFLQGCNLRCGCCHNPDTWDVDGGEIITSEEIIEKAIRFKEYFGAEGGITVSGGEPLMQSEFVYDIFLSAHEEGINTCLDTSGSIMNESVEKLLAVTDRVLLDIKYTDDEKYRKYVGCSLEKPLMFLEYLNEHNIPVTLRQVIIPLLNDNKESITELKKIIKNNKCIDKVELLPFKKICQIKYDKMGIPFRFYDLSEPSGDTMKALNKIIDY